MSHADASRHRNNPPYEPTGAIAKDSLANESIARGQGFSENPGAQAIGVKGYQSTLANEDTANAEVLAPARSRADRSDDDDEGGYVYADRKAGERAPRGAGVSAEAVGVRPYVDAAPGYAMVADGGGPKGKGLVEGGDVPVDRGTVVGEIGGVNDPGRLAERVFQKVNADVSGGLGVRQATSGRKGDGSVYDELDRSERA